MNTLEILERLIAFPTVSRNSNLNLISFVQSYLTERGVSSRLVHNADSTKANLFAKIGPADLPGVLLSGHTDVVPTDGQEWSSDPFHLTLRGGKLFGRGTADMKAFLACAMRAADAACRRKLKTPLWLSFSYDEEIGCIGVRRLIEVMAAENLRPAICIVGEPTEMRVATGHKGKTSLAAECIGTDAHTALAPNAVNALHLACDFVAALRRIQQQLASSGCTDEGCEIPYSTIHAARINGGEVPNIVPSLSTVEFEIRNIAADNPDEVIATLEQEARRIAERAQSISKIADIQVSVRNSYPGLDTPTDDPAVEFANSLTGQDGTIKVAFGTEGGLFAGGLGSSTVICGPGSMDQGHKPNEFIEAEQIAKCERMMLMLVDRLAAGI